ncbi:response regulator transcription factor [Nocardia sp. NPDC127579]|uniref:helix-turn-helix transcriptional regulator n=1 Tax=Nocardia sp. NPDC127579 TaxID=3345402 RepID=UPI00363E9C13
MDADDQPAHGWEQAKLLIGGVLDELRTSTERQLVTTDNLHDAVRWILGRGPKTMRIGLGTERYSRVLGEFREWTKDPSTKFAVLCSPDVQLGDVPMALGPERADDCRVAHVPVFNLILVDRFCAFIDHGRSGGLVEVDNGPMLEVLTNWFDQTWSLSPGYDIHSRLRERRECELTRDVIASLARGLKDETAAQRLGISVRTYRRHVAELYEDLGAQSRFQAGMRAERLLMRYWDAPTVPDPAAVDESRLSA